MTLAVPTTDDRHLWDTWLSILWFPSVAVADELGVFERLASGPATVAEIARQLGLDERGTGLLLTLLASLDFTVMHDGRYHITDTTRNFLITESPFYWGGVLARHRQSKSLCSSIRDALTRQPHVGGSKPMDAWETGRLDAERARGIAQCMHSHSVAPAVGVALHADFTGVTRLLDVGGGSGVFSIALARRYSSMQCTVMDLPAMCDVAAEYITAACLGDRVSTCGLDMLRHEWPSGHDAILLSNVIHDWSRETGVELAARAFAALPSGGRIYIHEMLLHDHGVGPRSAAAFAMLMLIGTRGQQYTFRQLRTLLEEAGFIDVAVAATYGYYSLTSARRP